MSKDLRGTHASIRGESEQAEEQSANLWQMGLVGDSEGPQGGLSSVAE